MTTQVETVPPDAPFVEALDRMRRLQLSCIVICASDRRPLGILSERDVVRILQQKLQEGPVPETLASLLGRTPISVSADATVGTAVKIQRQHGIRRLLVLDCKGRLTGLITQTDLARAYSLALERERDRLERLVTQRTRELQELNSELQEMALVDGLLGIGNRRAMDDMLHRIHEQAIRSGRAYGVALADIDYFKAYNDLYGHPQADAILRQVARALERSLRASDALFRYGGEEFLAVLPAVDLESACLVGERIRGAVEGLALSHAGTAHGIVTVSVGVAIWAAEGDAGRDAEPGSSDWQGIVRQADSALYTAKDGGRNQVASTARGKDT